MSKIFWLSITVSSLTKNCVKLIADFQYAIDNKDNSLCMIPFNETIQDIESSLEKIKYWARNNKP